MSGREPIEPTAEGYAEIGKRFEYLMVSPERSQRPSLVGLYLVPGWMLVATMLAGVPIGLLVGLLA